MIHSRSVEHMSQLKLNSMAQPLWNVHHRFLKASEIGTKLYRLGTDSVSELQLVVVPHLSRPEIIGSLFSLCWNSALRSLGGFELLIPAIDCPEQILTNRTDLQLDMHSPSDNCPELVNVQELTDFLGQSICLH